MITEESLPSHIKKVVFQYKRPEEQYEVFPSLIDVDGKRYYAIVYPPSYGRLIISEQGEVLPLKEVIKPALIAPAAEAAVSSLINFGSKWRKSYSLSSFRRLKLVLNYFIHKFRNKAPRNVQQAMNAFHEIPDILLELQETIAKCVDKGINLASKTNDREIFTEEDYYRLRKYKNDMVRSAYRQSEIQLRTEKNRNVVLGYLASNISWFNLKDWLYYGYIKFHNSRMLSESNFPKEAQEIKELSDKIFYEVPLEEHEEASEILEQYRNPK